jgi:hypothetical protein
MAIMIVVAALSFVDIVTIKDIGMAMPILSNPSGRASK